MMDEWMDGLEPIRAEHIRQVQLERLQAVMNRAARNVSYYHDLFRSIGLLPQDIASLADLARIPLTGGETLLERQPYGMLAAPPRDVVRVHTALGFQGKPIVVASTTNDIRHWTQLTARVLVRAKVSRDDAVQICLDYSQSTGGLAMHYGAESIGATVIPRSNILLRDQIDLLRNYRATVLVCTPSYARRLIYFIGRENFDAKTLFLRTVILVSEPWTEAIRREIAEKLFVNVYGAYGLDEIFNPGIAAEEPELEGLFLNQDHFIAEIIEPESQKVLGEGKTGELVLTTLTKEALPLIRYRTGELASLQSMELEGGRYLMRLQLTGQRTDDLIFVNGSKFYPAQIEQVLHNQFKCRMDYCVDIASAEDGDQVEVWLGVSEEVFQGEMVALTSIKDQLESDLYLKFGVTCHVRWVEKDTLRNSPSVRDHRREAD